MIRPESTIPYIAHDDPPRINNTTRSDSTSHISLQTISPDQNYSCPLCNWPESEEVEVDKELLLDRIVKEIHGFSLQALPWADDNGQETDERIEYSTKKVHDWLVENSLSVNPDQERPLREKRSYLFEYFEQNPCFDGSSVDSNSSDVETVLSWEVELENPREAHGPVFFTSRGGDIPSRKGSDDGEAYSEVDSYRPGSEPTF